MHYLTKIFLKTLKKEIYFRIISFVLIEIYEHVFLSRKTQNSSILKEYLPENLEKQLTNALKTLTLKSLKKTLFMKIFIKSYILRCLRFNDYSLIGFFVHPSFSYLLIAQFLNNPATIFTLNGPNFQDEFNHHWLLKDLCSVIRVFPITFQTVNDINILKLTLTIKIL